MMWCDRKGKEKAIQGLNRSICLKSIENILPIMIANKDFIGSTMTGLVGWFIDLIDEWMGYTIYIPKIKLVTLLY